MLRYPLETFEAGEADLYKDRAKEDPSRCASEVSAHEAKTSKIWPREVLTDEADYFGRGVAEGRHSKSNNSVESYWRDKGLIPRFLYGAKVQQLPSRSL
jgi:hypothetical protein